MEYLVDILMPVYNHELFIEKALTGVVSQKTNFAFRLLIADDFSTDKSREIIEEYQIIHPNIIFPFYREKNLGANENSKLLFKQIKSKYIAICEGDDYWTAPNKLQAQVDFLEANPDYSICFHKIQILKNNEIIDDYITKVPAEITDQTDLSNSNFIHTVSVVYRNIIKEMPVWFSRAMPGDYPLWLMLTVNNYKIKYLPVSMAVYRIHATGIWSEQDTSKYNQRVAFTMLTCVKYINIKPAFIQYYILQLADSIKEFGFKYLSRKEYLILALWSIQNTPLGMRNKLSILSMVYRKNSRVTKLYSKNK